MVEKHSGFEALGEIDVGAHDFTVDTDVLFVDSTGDKVGIRTTSPNQLLEISDSLNTTHRITSTDTNPSNDDVMGAIEFYSDASDGMGAGVRAAIKTITHDIVGSDYGELVFFVHDGTSLKEAMRINAMGDVSMANDLTVTKDLTVDTDTLFVSSGLHRVGVETDSPSRTLDVNGDISLETGSGDYYSNDGSQGWSGSFVEYEGKTVTVKNGIITDII